MPRITPSTGPRRSRRPSAGIATLAATLTIGLGLVLSGCAEDAEPAGPATSAATSETTPTSPTESSESVPPSEPEPQTIDITVSGDSVVPSGERVDAKVGEEIILHVTADAPGEIHVHSTPEQELTYQAGTTDLPLTIDQPGLVDVESHTLDLVIVQLEVR